ncbi:MAG TPA: hypothetical protein VHO95_09140 [Candidatus Dormibacteraeota bacterium]|nr:hypothetical protein [Candidatus Dormibacteraeota bacterium]
MPGQLGTHVDHMLAAVEEDETAAVLQPLCEYLEDRSIGVLFDAARRRKRVLQEPAVNNRGQIEQPHPAGVLLDALSCELKCKAGLANTARARQGDQARAVEQAPQIHQLRLSTDK